MAHTKTAALIRKACGVKRFDVADTQMTLIVAVAALSERGMPVRDAITFVCAIYRTAQRELTTKPAKATT